MSTKTDKIYYKGTIPNRSESKSLLNKAGDFLIVKREIPRLLILRCPCGCGDDLIINLDERAGPAWRLYYRKGEYSLYPSYWRDSACRSHFIIWNNNVYLFSKDDQLDEEWSVSQKTEDYILQVLKKDKFTHYRELADACGIVPWESLQACYQLLKKGLCIANDKLPKELFKKPNIIPRN